MLTFIGDSGIIYIENKKRGKPHMDYKVLIRRLIDERIAMFGAKATIIWLLDMDYTPEEIAILGFDKCDIDKIVESHEED